MKAFDTKRRLFLPILSAPSGIRSNRKGMIQSNQFRNPACSNEFEDYFECSSKMLEPEAKLFESRLATTLLSWHATSERRNRKRIITTQFIFNEKKVALSWHRLEIGWDLHETTSNWFAKPRTQIKYTQAQSTQNSMEKVVYARHKTITQKRRFTQKTTRIADRASQKALLVYILDK